MIALQQIKARKAPVGIGPLTLHLGPGITALLGAKADGVSLLLEVLAARAPVKAGIARVLELPRAQTRRAVGYVPLDAVLPDALRAGEALGLAAAIRGEPSPEDPRARLAAWGLEALADRRVRTLEPRELRAVALAEAMTSKVVRVVLLEEPFLCMDARAAARLPEQLRRRANEGACIVVGTASPRDARALAGRTLAMDRGALIEGPRPPRAAELHVVASDPRALAAALAGDAAVADFTASDRRVIVRGTDAPAMAHAVAQAVLASGATLIAMRLEPASEPLPPPQEPLQDAPILMGPPVVEGEPS